MYNMYMYTYIMYLFIKYIYIYMYMYMYMYIIFLIKEEFVINCLLLKNNKIINHNIIIIITYPY
jgi:hypothetical protein